MLIMFTQFLVVDVRTTLTNSTPADPGPTSAFLSMPPGAPVGARRYADRSSAERAGPSGLPTAPRRTVSGRTERLRVAGTISGGKCRKMRRYSMPSLVRYLEIRLNTSYLQNI